MSDTDTGLNYLNARYYESGIGRFVSQDPVFWEIGNTKRGQQAMMDPQQMNSYSYAGNNPINHSDPSGEFLFLLVPLIPTAIDVGVFLTTTVVGTMLASQAIEDPISVTPIGGIQQITNSVYGTDNNGNPLSPLERVEEGTFGAISVLAPLAALGKEVSTGKAIVTSGQDNLKIYTGISDVLGSGYRSIGEVTTNIKNTDLLQSLNKTSEGSWKKVYEAGIMEGKKVEMHYFRNNSTGEVFDIKQKYDGWIQKEFKDLSK